MSGKNPVKKFMDGLNKPSTHVDKKKRKKKGYNKHKKQEEVQNGQGN